MSLVSAWSFVRTQLGVHKAQVRFCLRLTLAALLAFGLAQFGNFPLRGLWAVLTAIVVTQVSVGGSLLAITEYVVGTLAGAIYASAIALLVPHATTLALAGALVLSVAPLALSAGLNPMFRVAPFTAVIVLFISTEFSQSPIDSAMYRVLEVLLGGLSTIVVSLLVMPEKAHGRGLEAAANVLKRLGQVLPELLDGFSRDLGAHGILRIQDGLGAVIAQFQTVVADTKRERLTYLHPAPDFESLSRTLLRLRHDFVILGRAAVAPLPEAFLTPLAPLLDQVGKTAGDYLHRCATGLVAGRAAPPLDTVEAAFESYAAEFAALRQAGFTRTLPSHETERVFALSFALEQLHRNLLDLQRCMTECAGPSIPAAIATERVI